MSDTDTDQVDLDVDADGADGDADAAAEPVKDAQKSYTQRQLDDMVRYRVKKKDEELAQLKSKLQEFEDEKKTDLEKAQERAAQLEQQIADAAKREQDALLRAAVVSEAARKNVVDPDAAVVLIDRSALEFDDTGSPTNIAQAMDSLLEAKPYLVAKNGGARGDADLGARRGGANQLTREDLAALSAAGKHDEILKAKAEGRLDTVMGAKT